MPIYKQKNAKTKVTAQEIAIKYHDGENNLAKESTVVHFGYGDILVVQGRSRNEHSDELCFQHATEAHEIGEREKEVDNTLIFPPVRFVFDRKESIQVVIDHLLELQEQYP